MNTSSANKLYMISMKIVIELKYRLTVVIYFFHILKLDLSVVANIKTCRRKCYSVQNISVYEYLFTNVFEYPNVIQLVAFELVTAEYFKFIVPGHGYSRQ